MDPSTVFGYDKQTGEYVEFETNDPELFAEYAQALEDAQDSAASLGEYASETAASSAGAHAVSQHYQSHGDLKHGDEEHKGMENDTTSAAILGGEVHEHDPDTCESCLHE